MSEKFRWSKKSWRKKIKPDTEEKDFNVIKKKLALKEIKEIIHKEAPDEE